MDIKGAQENSDAVNEKSEMRNKVSEGEEAQGYASKSGSMKQSSMINKV